MRVAPLPLLHAHSYTRHANALFLGIDGNFRAVLKRKRHDREDVPLLDGRSYFVPSEKYLEYERTAPTDPAEVRSTPSGVAQSNGAQHKSTCSNLRSMSLVTNRKGVEVTGIVAVVCVRHSCYCINSLVDMTVGEK